MIDVEIQRADQRFLDRWRWGKVATRWADEMGPVLASAVRDKAPVGKKEVGGHNGQLRDSITYRKRITKTSAAIEIVSNVNYAEYVIHGTPRHMIYPRIARRLHWVEGGNHFYRYRVNHPGYRGNNFPERGARSVGSTAKNRLSTAVINATTRGA